MAEPTSLQLLFGLGQNAALLGLGLIAFCWVRAGLSRLPRAARTIVESAILGALAVYTMINAASPGGGILFDGRYIMVAIATLFSGPVAGGLVLAVVAGCRLLIGGDGVLAGIAGTSACYLILLAFRRHFLRLGRPASYAELALLGSSLAATSLVSLVLLPDPSSIPDYIARIGLPFLAVTTLGLPLCAAIVRLDDQRRRLLQEVADNEVRFRAVIDNLPLTLSIKSLDGYVTHFNKRCAEEFGAPPMPGLHRSQTNRMTYEAGMAAPNQDDDATVIATGRPVVRHSGPIKVGGTVREKIYTTFPVPNARGETESIGTVTVDVTDLRTHEREREDLEARLLQATKMEAIGQLAGGIAHDFNNLIGAIVGFAGFLVQDLRPGSEEQLHARRIVRICERAETLVSHILAFSRTDRVERHPLDLRALLAETRDLLRGGMPRSTVLNLALGPAALPILGNEGQIGQIVVNLCLNANDALAGGAGEIGVRLDRMSGPAAAAELASTPSDPGFHAINSGTIQPDGDYARISVADTGAGMTEAVLKRIAEPFFTTKERGRGTGLGLAMVHGIVLASGGAYRVESAPGRGTRFTLYFPTATLSTPAEPPARSEPVNGKERVLVVDDELDITDVLMIGLERLGYEVACLNDPVEALQVFEEDPSAWDVVISDQVMPGMNGTALIACMKRHRPDLKAILYTGYAAGVTEGAAREAGADAFLTKPLDPRRVAGHIRALASAS